LGDGLGYLYAHHHYSEGYQPHHDNRTRKRTNEGNKRSDEMYQKEQPGKMARVGRYGMGKNRRGG